MTERDAYRVWLEGLGRCTTEGLWTLFVSVGPVKKGPLEVESVESITEMGAMVIRIVRDRGSP